MPRFFALFLINIFPLACYSLQTNTQAITTLHLKNHLINKKAWSSRLLIDVQFGNLPPVPMIIDTGSGGAVVNCSALLRNQVFTLMDKTWRGNKLCQLLKTGHFPQTIKLPSAGIEITHQFLSRTYGKGVGKPHTDKGYLAYAVLTMRDSYKNQIKTTKMPFFLAYQYHCHAGGCGTLGINSKSGALKQIISPIYYIPFEKGIDPGFILRGNFSYPENFSQITFGLNEENKKGFQFISLTHDGNAPNNLFFWSPYVMSAITIKAKKKFTFYPVKTLIDSGAGIPTFSTTQAIELKNIEYMQVNIVSCNTRICSQQPQKQIASISFKNKNFRVRVSSKEMKYLNTGIQFFFNHIILYDFKNGLYGIKKTTDSP